MGVGDITAVMCQRRLECGLGLAASEQGERLRTSREAGGGCVCRRPAVAPALPDMVELAAAAKSGDLAAVAGAFAGLGGEAAARLAGYRAPQTRESLLFGASVKGHTAVVRCLLAAAGPGQIALRTVWGAGPLHAAAERCHEPVVRLLIDSGADLDAQTSYGDTALHLAAYRGHYAAVRCLVESGCKLAVRNSKYKTALDDATGEGHGRVVRYLTAVMYPAIYGGQTSSEARREVGEKEEREEAVADLMRTRPLRGELCANIRACPRADRPVPLHGRPSSAYRGRSNSIAGGSAYISGSNSGGTYNIISSSSSSIDPNSAPSINGVCNSGYMSSSSSSNPSGTDDRSSIDSCSNIISSNIDSSSSSIFSNIHAGIGVSRTRSESTTSAATNSSSRRGSGRRSSSSLDDRHSPPVREARQSGVGEKGGEVEALNDLNAPASWEAPTSPVSPGREVLTVGGCSGGGGSGGGGMETIPETGSLGFHPAGRAAEEAAAAAAAAAGTPLHPGRARQASADGGRPRSASDARLEYLEKMVEYLREGLTVAQAELGRTKAELRRARERSRSPTSPSNRY